MLKLLNYENLHHFASILNTITLNIELNENKSDYDVNFAIIYIAERTFFCNNDYVKTYLCSIPFVNCTIAVSHQIENCLMRLSQLI